MIKNLFNNKMFYYSVSSSFGCKCGLINKRLYNEHGTTELVVQFHSKGAFLAQLIAFMCKTLQSMAGRKSYLNKWSEL